MFNQSKKITKEKKTNKQDVRHCRTSHTFNVSHFLFFSPQNSLLCVCVCGQSIMDGEGFNRNTQHSTEQSGNIEQGERAERPDLTVSCRELD